MRRKDVLSSPKLRELKEKRRRNLRNKILVAFFGVLGIFIGLIFIFRIDKLNIKEIKISGNKVVDTELIQKVARDNLGGHYLYFLPKSNFLLLPKKQIEKDLTDNYKRLKDISINLDNAETLSISVAEREGKYLWCGEGLPAVDVKPEESPCSFMDDSGYAFDTAPYFSGNVYFRFYGPLTENKFAPEVWGKLVPLKENFTSTGLRPVSLYVKDDGDIEIYLSSNVLPPHSPKIILKKDFDLGKIVENVQAAINTDPLMSDLKNKFSQLEYIDLRFGNKVYFKFR